MPTFNNAIKTKQIPVQDLVPHKSSTEPADPVSGQLWVDTSVTPNRLKTFENGAWVLASQAGAELLANKGVANGYPSLDSGTKVPIAQLPTGTSASTVPLGIDARFSDQRVPTDNSVTGGTTGAGVKIAQATITDANIAAGNKDGLAATPSLRTLGTGATQAVSGTDARLSDERVPTDNSVTGGTGAGAKIQAATITDANIAAANKDGTAGTPSMRTLGTGASQAAPGNDARLSDARIPTGNAGGDLTGTFPNPTVANLAITDAKVAVANKDGAAGVPSMRTLGTDAQQALAGNTRLDQLAQPTADVSMNSRKLTSLADPVADTDGANKRYVDSARAGLRLKDAVRAATTGPISLSGTQTVDGVALIAGDRVLVKNQADASDNGIYVVASGAWARATDADTASELADGATTFAQEGATQANTTWAQINTVTALTQDQSWVQQGAATVYNAGAGLFQTGQTFDVVAADGSITVNADSITVGNVPVAKGGTGATTGVGARSNIGATGKFTADLGAFTAGSEMTVTHGLNTVDLVGVTIKNVVSGFLEEFDIRVIDENTIGITSGVAHSSGVYRVVVGG